MKKEPPTLPGPPRGLLDLGPELGRLGLQTTPSHPWSGRRPSLEGPSVGLLPSLVCVSQEQACMRLERRNVDSRVCACVCAQGTYWMLVCCPDPPSRTAAHPPVTRRVGYRESHLTQIVPPTLYSVTGPHRGTKAQPLHLIPDISEGPSQLPSSLGD